MRPLLALLLLGFLASPVLAQGCGDQNPNCIVPTAPPGTNNNQAASTAFVQTAVGGGGSGSIAIGTTPVTGGSPNGVIYDANGVAGLIATVASGVMVTDNAGAPSFSINLTVSGVFNAASTFELGGNAVSLSGSTYKLGTVSGALTNGDCLIANNGNIVDSGSSGCGSGSASPAYQIFATPGAVTTLTLTATPLPTNGGLVSIAFDGVVQARNTWSINVSTSVITFDAAIPSNVQIVEVDWWAPNTLAGISSITAGADVITGAAILAGGAGISVTGSGQTATVTNSGVVGLTTPNSTLSLSGSSGSITEDINLAHANVWSASVGLTNTTPVSFQNTSAATDAQIFEDSGNNLNMRAGATGLINIFSNSGGTQYAALGLTNTFFTNGYFGSGSPWVDVKSGTNGCAAAVGNGSTNDTAAINCQILYMYNNVGGGVVYFPPGTYVTTTGITSKGTVRLVGAGRLVSTIDGHLHNVPTLTFDSTVGRGAGLENLAVWGRQSAGATASAVVSQSVVGPDFDHCLIIYGYAALNTQSNDSHMYDCYVEGETYSVVSTGANWYVNSAFDTGYISGVRTAAYFQTTPGNCGGGVCENHFLHNDFSGQYSYSVIINDGTGSNAITVFTGTVMSSPILIQNAYWTEFQGAEFGASGGQFATNSPTTIIGGYGLNGTLILSGSGTRQCSANFNITC
jgi:hypothetical protein